MFMLVVGLSSPSWRALEMGVKTNLVCLQSRLRNWPLLSLIDKKLKLLKHLIISKRHFVRVEKIYIRKQLRKMLNKILKLRKMSPRPMTLGPLKNSSSRYKIN
jgi:hypothetical protein